MAAVVFDNFSYAYNGSTKVLDSIKLTIPDGSFTVITGPSGAGKTTLCLSICGVVPHYCGGSVGGRAMVAGLDTRQSTISILAEKVGTVLEDYEAQLVTMTVEEEVAFGLENRGEHNSVISERVGKMLQLVGLKGLEKNAVTALSGGQKQRLAIAAVLATQPEILVLDEPASALDPEGAGELYTLLAQLNRENGITVVVVEHDLSRVLQYADQIVLMNEGCVAAVGDMGQVFRTMYRQSIYAEGIPPLWQIKLQLEEQTGEEFGGWSSIKDALPELRMLFDAVERGAAQSA